MTADEIDRTRIRTQHDETLFVEAGAGTGKTTTLVKRVVRLFATGRLEEPRQLAAITFTEAAASELRDRIRARLEAAGSSSEGLDDPVERASFDSFFTFFRGGVAAFEDGERVGAVGVSGLPGEQDEALALAGLAAAGLAVE